ncbi:hypothetical protein AVEN_182424-1 [Araneus ventricosus]|uniref:Uncharacterized protein n=1 Tax=Araneus ventricosus TaxID=182803 RepID=A0A4Y2VSS7_ARAVE|nr:hypothetical protein AVEN_182424-1 [Araneus ventricosus]
MGVREVGVQDRWLMLNIKRYSDGNWRRTYEVGIITLISRYDPEQRISVERCFYPVLVAISEDSEEEEISEEDVIGKEEDAISEEKKSQE